MGRRGGAARDGVHPGSPPPCSAAPPGLPGNAVSDLPEPAQHTSETAPHDGLPSLRPPPNSAAPSALPGKVVSEFPEPTRHTSETMLHAGCPPLEPTTRAGSCTASLPPASRPMPAHRGGLTPRGIAFRSHGAATWPRLCRGLGTSVPPKARGGVRCSVGARLGSASRAAGGGGPGARGPLRPARRGEAPRFGGTTFHGLAAATPRRAGLTGGADHGVRNQCQRHRCSFCSRALRR